ncbi:unnamed protein product [Ilex paraguariensis]|uniref:Pectinesterase catalytic domain-containing protein n=1 Tax=Ilex paraguariensis TaxID=185542 RepID=A0ABC8RMD0_9AQUA
MPKFSQNKPKISLPQFLKRTHIQTGKRETKKISSGHNGEGKFPQELVKDKKKILSLVIILGLGCIVQSQLIPQSGITVAQDGSGNFTTISDAVDAAPTYSKQTYYIQIKAGTYAEYIIVGVKKTNIAFIGDGIGATIITGNKSNGTHYSTYDSATVDIIFGNAKVVFQNCSIFVHNPGQRHSNVITAQGRGTSDQITGISIHNCKIMPAKDFNSNLGIKTYLGRPWRKFSTVVIMKSFLSNIIDPEGWLKWNNATSSLSSLYYGEYHNKGPGSITVKRVRWEGVHKAMNIVEAENFTDLIGSRGSRPLLPLKF